MNYKVKKGDFTGTEKLFKTRNEAEEYAKNSYWCCEIYEKINDNKWKWIGSK
jgi:hypothetical protein